MRRIGSWLMILFSLGALAGMYFVTPYLSHVQSHVLQFLSVLAAAVALAICLVLLIGGVMMRSDKMPQPRRVAVPMPPKVPVTPPLPIELDSIGRHIEFARNETYNPESVKDAHNRIDELSNALALMFAVAKRNAGTK